jgi:site-specific DNA-cytosine methylase
MSSDWRGLNRNQNQTAIMDENIINSLIDNPVILHNIYGGFKEKNVRVFTEKSPTIRTAAGGGHIPSTVDLEKLMLSPKAIEYMDRLRNGKPRWEYHTNPLDGKAACLTANMFKGVTYGVIKELVRKLHPIECERLQTVPDNYTEGVSDTQRYKMLGNGWTVDVVASIFKGIVEYEGSYLLYVHLIVYMMIGMRIKSIQCAQYVCMLMKTASTLDLLWILNIRKSTVNCTEDYE